MEPETDSGMLSDADRLHARNVARWALREANKELAPYSIAEIEALMRIAEIGDRLSRGPLP